VLYNNNYALIRADLDFELHSKSGTGTQQNG